MISYSFYQVKGLVLLRVHLLLGFVLKCIYWSILLLCCVFPAINLYYESSLRFTDSFWCFILWFICRCSRWSNLKGESCTSKQIIVWRPRTGLISSPKLASATRSASLSTIPQPISMATGCAVRLLQTTPLAAPPAQGKVLVGIAAAMGMCVCRLTTICQVYSCSKAICWYSWFCMSWSKCWLFRVKMVIATGC